MKKTIFLSITFLFVFFNLFAQSSDSATVYFEKGMVEKNARRYREAEKHFRKSIEFNGSNLESQLQLANALMEQRRYVEARDIYLKAEAIDASNPIVIENLMTLSYNTRKWEDAIKYAKKWQQIQPGKGAYFMIAQAYYEMENYGEAVKFCEAAYKDDPKNPKVTYIAARAFMDMNNYKKAAGCFEQALALDSSNATWMYEAGLAWYAVPDDKKSLYWIEKAGQKGYKKTNDYMENLASAYINTGNFEKGIGIMEELLKNKPQDTELLYSIAESYYKIKKYQEAIDYWDKILAIDKKNANALYMIGMAYQKKGDTAKGTQLCDKAIEMDPSLKKLKEERKMPGGL